MTRKIWIIKGTKQKLISSKVLADIIVRYGIVGFTYNDFGQVLYLHNQRGTRIHSIVVSSNEYV